MASDEGSQVEPWDNTAYEIALDSFQQPYSLPLTEIPRSQDQPQSTVKKILPQSTPVQSLPGQTDPYNVLTSLAMTDSSTTDQDDDDEHYEQPGEVQQPWPPSFAVSRATGTWSRADTVTQEMVVNPLHRGGVSPSTMRPMEIADGANTKRYKV